MSAYGAIAPPTLVAPLEVLSYPLPNGLILTTHPTAAAEAPRDLIEYLHGVFTYELDGVSPFSCPLRSLTYLRGKDLPSRRTALPRSVRKLLLQFGFDDSHRYTPCFIVHLDFV